MKTNFKNRKKLKGHFGKVYALHWAADAERVVRVCVIWIVHTASNVSFVCV